MQAVQASSLLLLSGLVGACAGAEQDPGHGDQVTAAPTATELNTEAPTPTDTGQSRCATEASQTFVRPFEVDRTQYPFESCAFQAQAGLMHYVDAGPKDAEHTVLMLHGNPTWSFLYRNVAPALLADGHRVILPDHVGMGMSDIPPTEAFDYRPRNHAKHLEALVLALALDNITLVVQDWGGPTGLDVATRQPDRFARILILNTWAWSVDAEDPGEYHQLIDWYNQTTQAAALVPNFFCQLALPGQAELMALEADPTEGEVYEAVLEAYISPAIDPETGDYRTDEPCAPMQILPSPSWTTMRSRERFRAGCLYSRASPTLSCSA